MQRLQLDPSKHYNIVTYSTMTARDVEYVGQFVRSYTEGSGNEQYIFWEFMRYGQSYKFCDSLHGYRDADLIVFEEVKTDR
jgi:hypothetical protein